MYYVFGRDNCSYCKKAVELLYSKGLPYTYINLQSPEQNIQELRYKMIDELGVKTVPVIFKGDLILNKDTILFSDLYVLSYVGGYEELKGSIHWD